MRGVVVGLTGLFRAHAAARRRWSDVAALAPVVARERQSTWLEPLPSLEGIAAAAGAIGGPARLEAHPGVRAAAAAWAVPLGLGLDGEARVAILGPDAVESEVDAAVAEARRVAVVCPDDGEGPVEPPPGGVWIADPWAGEGARGVLGAGILTALALAGMDVAAALGGAAAMAEACRSAVAENPAWSLARALRLCAQDLARDAVVHVAAEPALLPLAAWAARAQAGVLAAPSAVGPARPLPVAVDGEDEDWAQVVLASRDTVVVVWEVGGGRAAHRYAEAGVPILRITLPGLDAEALGGAFRLWLGTLAALARLEERPLAD